jgi:hypothetical protein
MVAKDRTKGDAKTRRGGEKGMAAVLRCSPTLLNLYRSTPVSTAITVAVVVLASLLTFSFSLAGDTETEIELTRYDINFLTPTLLAAGGGAEDSRDIVMMMNISAVRFHSLKSLFDDDPRNFFGKGSKHMPTAESEWDTLESIAQAEAPAEIKPSMRFVMVWGPQSFMIRNTSENHVKIFGNSSFDDSNTGLHHYHIGRAIMELDMVPDAWQHAWGQMDELWVPTHFHRKVLQANGLANVHVVPEVVHVGDFDSIADAELRRIRQRIPPARCV